MNAYATSNQALQSLIRSHEVHRDVFTSPEIFELEMQRLFSRTWVYVGHASQVPEVGDYFATTVGDQSVVMVRHATDDIRVIYNRCAHKGVQVVSEGQGNTG
ncbi:MAG: Rieske 2Fe-2S domain-containing protein, partial [Burkholderiaceae bacterium]